MDSTKNPPNADTLRRWAGLGFAFGLGALAALLFFPVLRGSILALYILGPATVFFVGLLAGVAATLGSPAMRLFQHPRPAAESDGAKPKPSPAPFPTPAIFVAWLCSLCAVAILSFVLGFSLYYACRDIGRLERNFQRVHPGMTTGEALKTVFEEVFVYPERSDRPNIENWAIWNYDLIKTAYCRAKGSSPFTLTVDTTTGRVIQAQYEYNTRFD